MNRFSSIRIAAVAFACLGLAACGSSTPSPTGWTATGASTWTSATGQTYALSTVPFSGSRTDLSNQESVNIVLSHKGEGVTFDGSQPYPGCEGAGGLMTFTEKQPKPGKVMLLGFMVLNGTATTVVYERPTGQPIDPAATSAMRQTVCRV